MADLTAGELGYDECDEGWTGIDCLDCLPGYSGEYCEKDEAVQLGEPQETQTGGRFSNGVTVDTAPPLQDESHTQFSAGLTVTEAVTHETKRKQWWYDSHTEPSVVLAARELVSCDGQNWHALHE